MSEWPYPQISSCKVSMIACIISCHKSTQNKYFFFQNNHEKQDPVASRHPSCLSNVKWWKGSEIDSSNLCTESIAHNLTNLLDNISMEFLYFAFMDSSEEESSSIFKPAVSTRMAVDIYLALPVWGTLHLTLSINNLISPSWPSSGRMHCTWGGICMGS